MILSYNVVCNDLSKIGFRSGLWALHFIISMFSASVVFITSSAVCLAQKWQANQDLHAGKEPCVVEGGSDLF